MNRRIAILVAVSAVVGTLVGFFTGNLSRETKMPGEALKTEDATGHWERHAESSVDLDAEVVTNTRIRLVMQAIPTYSLLHAGRYPESLADLISDDLLGAEVVRDGWGRPLVYTLDSERRRYTVSSLGADGVPSEDDIPRPR